MDCPSPAMMVGSRQAMAARSVPATHQAATTTRDAVVASCSPTLSPKPKSWRQRTSGCATNSRKQKPSCTSNVESITTVWTRRSHTAREATAAWIALGQTSTWRRRRFSGLRPATTLPRTTCHRPQRSKASAPAGAAQRLCTSVWGVRHGRRCRARRVRLGRVPRTTTTVASLRRASAHTCPWLWPPPCRHVGHRVAARSSTPVVGRACWIACCAVCGARTTMTIAWPWLTTRCKAHGLLRGSACPTHRRTQRVPHWAIGRRGQQRRVGLVTECSCPTCQPARSRNAIRCPPSLMRRTDHRRQAPPRSPRSNCTAGAER
mmetsp:Transcript_4469/g.9580  ORF Transcript_4469/g.9580 Transcript_4469/m.9580 type:complete len:319 (-) Transcript_4469:65-1021(-)